MKTESELIKELQTKALDKCVKEALKSKEK